MRAFEQQLHRAALQRFVQDNFVAVAGRADVKVAQAAASVAIRDSLVAAPRSALAIKGTAPGQTIGIALEPSSPDRATLKVLLSLGGNGGSDGFWMPAQLADGLAPNPATRSSDQ